MNGLGNYRFAPQVERKTGEVIAFRADKATVRFRDGQTYSIPAEPLRRIGVAENEPFILIVVRQGKQVTEVRVERPPPARPARPLQTMPKVVVRDGRKLTTRR